MSLTWKPKKNCPQTIDELRKALISLAANKAGKELIAAKFTRDHIYAGHKGSIEDLAIRLSHIRGLPASTIMISSMDATAREEVINWIGKAPEAAFTLQNGTWNLRPSGNTVQACHSYRFATVDAEELRNVNPDDRVKKCRKWLTESLKTPHVACRFDAEDTGLVQIFHLDY